MDEDFFDRLDKFMNMKGLNDNQITVQAGLSQGAIGKQRKKGRGLSVDSIAKILYAYPMLNADWLLTGRGEMLKEESNTECVVDSDLLFDSDFCKTIIKSQQSTIHSQQSTISVLSNLLGNR